VDQQWQLCPVFWLLALQGDQASQTDPQASAIVEGLCSRGPLKGRMLRLDAVSVAKGKEE
jgi:hypothetical protein